MKWQIKSGDVTIEAFRIRPPFTRDSALAKVKVAENAWNTRDPQIVAQAYTEDSDWRSRTEFFKGRKAIKAFLKHQWETELDYRLMEELWCFSDNRISARSSTSGTTRTGNGIAHTETNSGSSTVRGWLAAAK